MSDPPADDKATLRDLRASPIHDLAPGTVLAGRYRILDPIGAGGMGAIYEAEQIELRRRVAIKLVLNSGGESYERLRREALGASAVHSPHVVTVFDFHWEEGEPPFLVMELLSGQALADVMADEGALPFPRACRLACQILDGLAAAHRVGLVHRDVKPANVWLVPTMAGELVKLLDFGLVKNVEDGVGITARSGRLLGTRAYLAPEQIYHQPPDPRSDLHAVGVVLWEMLTGKRIWQGTGPEVFAEIVARVPDRVSDLMPSVPAALSEAVARALAKDPEGRFRDAGEMLAAIAPFAAERISSTSVAPDEPPPTVGIAPEPPKGFVATAKMREGARVSTAVMAPIPARSSHAPRSSVPSAAPSAPSVPSLPSASFAVPPVPPSVHVPPSRRSGIVVVLLVVLAIASGLAWFGARWVRTHARPTTNAVPL